jgi:hypothetical protein
MYTPLEKYEKSIFNISSFALILLIIPPSIVIISMVVFFNVLSVRLSITVLGQT